MLGNSATLLGNLTRDVEIRYLANKTAVGNFSLATNRSWTDDNGQKREEVLFMECEVWGKLAELLAEWTSKGDKILVSGRLKQETWEDKNGGGKRSKIVLSVDESKFINLKKSKRESEPDPTEPRQNSGAQKKTPPRGAQKPHDPELDPEEVEFLPND